VPRILVLEDEPLIAMMLQGWLEEIGCETIGPAHTVQSALDLLQGARPMGRYSTCRFSMAKSAIPSLRTFVIAVFSLHF
jgi:CheY-like chemotaxis protein